MGQYSNTLVFGISWSISQGLLPHGKDLRTFTEFRPEAKRAIIEGVQKEAGGRSIEELERERDAMPLELLARRAKGEKATQAPGGRGESDSIT